MDYAALLQQLKAQEETLQFTSFSNEDAVTIGMWLYRTAKERNLPITIDIMRNGQQLFHLAMPGTSEHQSGLCADLHNLPSASQKFADTPEYRWLFENCAKFGFILRYPKDKEYITGYQFEAWHYRYVGNDIAKYIYENNITYEEYYAYYLR